jgi:hypothetical protein
VVAEHRDELSLVEPWEQVPGVLLPDVQDEVHLAAVVELHGEQLGGVVAGAVLVRVTVVDEDNLADVVVGGHSV